jgi:hypothetical protein
MCGSFVLLNNYFNLKYTDVQVGSFDIHLQNLLVAGSADTSGCYSEIGRLAPKLVVDLRQPDDKSIAPPFFFFCANLIVQTKRPF